MSSVNAEAVSVVIPLHNEAANLQPLHKRLTETLQRTGRSYHIYFVDDGSTDNTWSQIQELSQQDKHLCGLSLARNFGHQTALLAGLEAAQGQYIAMMDGDLQHPPELLETMLAKAEEGVDIVNTRRKDGKGTSLFKRGTSALFYTLINKLSDTPIPKSGADYRLMTRQALDAFLRIRERDRFTRGLVSWMGFSQATVNFEAEPRKKGRSKYSTGRMIRFALDGITSFSARPLRIAFFIGLLIALLGAIYAAIAIIAYAQGRTIEGWTSILVTVLLIGGIQLITLGVIGEYLARVFSESKGRPHYFIRERINVPEEEQKDDL